MTNRPGQIAVLVSLVSIVATLYLASRPASPPYPVGGGSRVQEAIGRMPIDPEAEARIERLRPRLAAMNEAPERSAAPLDLALLGYREIVPPAAAPAPAPARQPVAEPYAYVVSMTYVSSDRRFAVINGRFYREGGRLPGGERVVAILPSAVRVALDEKTRNLEIVKEPITLSGENGVIRNDAGDLGGREAAPSESGVADAAEN